ncbi:fungal specific transcription factor [Colletotrichum tofieldiae]|nr:fungal specific transcription factor [Colletotrichum tofieldiae]
MASSSTRWDTRLSIDAEVDLKVIQIMAMISIYYFFSDEELLAWRNIGIAARAALEMGLHQNLSLTDNFPDPEIRSLAVRVFWCVYVLDRRWSFGTSLSFALFDRDIDPNLPEPI